MSTSEVNSQSRVNILHSLRATLIFLFLSIALLPILGIGLFVAYQVEQTTRTSVTKELQLIRDLKATQVSQYIHEHLTHVKTFSRNPQVIATMQALRHVVSPSQTSTTVKATMTQVRQAYLGKTDTIDAKVASAYKQVHAQYHDFFYQYLQDYNYHDIFLIEPNNSTILYSVRKKNDFGLSLEEGKYVHSNLARAVQRAASSQQNDLAILEDFAPYPPSHNQIAAFIASPIFVDDLLIGVLVFQFHINQLNALIQKRTNIGETEETILIGADDFLLRSNSRFLTQSSILNRKVDNAANRAAAMGETGVVETLDYRGKDSFIAYMPLDIPNVQWLLNVKIDKAEVYESIYTLRAVIFNIVLFVSLLIIVLAIFFSHMVAQPIKKITTIFNHIAAGDMSPQMANQDQGKGEIAAMLRAAQRMTWTIRQIIDNSDTFLEQIADSNLTYVKGEFPGDFAKLKRSLENAAHKLAETTAANNHQNYLKFGLALLDERLRGDKDIVLLSKSIIDFLTNYLKLPIGLLYILKNIKDGENYLELTAMYGCSQHDPMITRKFYSGEALVGQMMLEPTPIMHTHAEIEIYTMMHSGLARVIPKYVYVIPFLYDDQLKGVIEIGSPTLFTELQREFLQQAMLGVGIAVNTTQARDQMQYLLQQSQALTTKLQQQKQEIQDKNEELQSQTEELQNQQENLQAQQDELRQINEDLIERSQLLFEEKNAVKEKNVALEAAKTALQTKAKELELISQYKSEFLSNMSHELRTPLNSLLILARLLADNKEHNLTAKQVESAQTIYHSGVELLNLINDLLDLSKIEAGKVDIRPQFLSLQEFVTTLQQRFSPLAEKNFLYFNIQLADDLPDTIYIDPQRLQQVVNNLLSNAFKFTEKGGVSLELRRPKRIENITHAGLNANNSIAISVSDTGIGIPKDKQASIFEAFQQADNTTSRRFGGTGLGLSISRQFIQLMGGEIQLNSIVNQGSCFTVFLPEYFSPTSQPPSLISTVKSQTPVPPKKQVSKLEPESATVGTMEKKADLPLANQDDDRNALQTDDKSLLIIEDDPVFARILMNLAHEQAFKCLLAEDGKSGLDMAEHYCPDAIILDIWLPQTNGWVVMERLKANPHTRHIPVHFISCDDSQHQQAKNMGAIGYTLKSSNVDELAEVLACITHFTDKKVKNLLLVTDDEEYQQTTHQLIEGDYVLIDVVTTLTDAWKKLNDNTYECAILDLAIEQNTGIQLLQKLADNIALAHLPVIIYTERELSDTEKFALQSHAVQLTLKTVKSTEDLLDEVTLFLHAVATSLSETQQKMLQTVHNKEKTLQGKKVLLVDDDSRNLFALTSALEEKGMETYMATNGKEALKRLTELSQIDIVLMDIMMPEMDGYETMQNIRKQPDYRELPIIALTAKAMKSDFQKCIEAGASDYLSKPVDINKLLSLMRIWLYK